MINKETHTIIYIKKSTVKKLQYLRIDGSFKNYSDVVEMLIKEFEK